MTTSNPNWPQCACYLFQERPELLDKTKLPRGHCGRCQICSQPGHTRSHPTDHTIVGEWCDEHYQKLWQEKEYDEIVSTATCYCFLWKIKPETLKEMKIPEGFCGLCDDCGKPGHTRAYGAFTGSWCDAHWTELISKKKNDS